MSTTITDNPTIIDILCISANGAPVNEHHWIRSWLFVFNICATLVFWRPPPRVLHPYASHWYRKFMSTWWSSCRWQRNFRVAVLYWLRMPDSAIRLQPHSKNALWIPHPPPLVITAKLLRRGRVDFGKLSTLLQLLSPPPLCSTYAKPDPIRWGR